MSEQPAKLTEWLKADCAFDEVAARKMLAAHDAGRYDEAAGFLMDAFCWSAAPWPHMQGPVLYWGKVRDRLQEGRRQPVAMNIIRIWLGEPLAWPRKPEAKMGEPPGDTDWHRAHEWIRGSQWPTKTPTVPSEPTEDQVATWLAARGMTMIDTKELAALKRNGTGGPPPIDGDTLRRISRY